MRKKLWAGKQAERRDHMARLRRRLCGATYFALLNDLDAFAQAPPLLLTAAGPAGQVLEARVERGLAEVLDLADRAAAADELGDGSTCSTRSAKPRSGCGTPSRRSPSRTWGPGEGTADQAGGFELGAGPSARMHLATDVQDALGAHRDSVMFQKHVRGSARTGPEGGAQRLRLRGAVSGRSWPSRTSR